MRLEIASLRPLAALGPFVGLPGGRRPLSSVVHYPLVAHLVEQLEVPRCCLESVP